MFKNKSLNTIGFIIAFLGAVLFSTKAIIVKLAFANTAVSPIALLALRMLFSLPFYLVIAYFSSNKKNNIRLTPKEWFYVSLIGLMGYYISSLLDFLGLQYVSAGMERLILFLYPTFAVLINAWLFKQAINIKQKIALVLCYAGIGLAYFGEIGIQDANADFIWGSIMIFICAITYSIYLVGSGQLIPKVGATKFTAFAMLAASVGVFAHFAVAATYQSIQLNNTLVFYSFLLAIVATVIPSFMISYGMKTIGANNTAIITSIGPVSTILQAHFILGEKIFLEQVLGTVLVMSGVLLIGWRSKLCAE